jgi:protein-disulfide isomerase
MNHENYSFNIQTSILVAALIISGSLLYSANVLKGGSIGNTATAAPAAPENIKVAGRKGEPSEGTGKVTVVEFSDFQCPFCKSFYDGAYKGLKAKYIDTGKVTFIYRHFPLSFHQNAEKAAEAAECANMQGKFWQYHDVLFAKSQSDGTGLNVPDLKTYAANVGLDTTKFNSCLDGGETADIVKADQAEGQKAGVTGTPSFVIDGKLVIGAQPLAAFESALDAALK